MTLEEKASKTLAELGVIDPAGVEALFTELRTATHREFDDFHQSAPTLPADQAQKQAEHLRDRWLSRHKGLITLANANWLKLASKSLKPATGQQFNLARLDVEKRVRLALDYVHAHAALGANIRAGLKKVSAELGAAVEAERRYYVPQLYDLTLPGYRRPLGSIHPVTRVQREIEEIFLGLGFSIETGPEIESVYYNFDALNIPETHPSRDDFDTIYIDSNTLLRTHTSPVQIRAMEKYARAIRDGGRDEGLYIIIPGKCYRNDNPDATHSPMFHQVEGLAVDKDITFADLKGTLDFFAKKFFGERTRTSFHPSFFPFTEPSGEVAVSCFVCDGRGCRTCKQSGWIEVMGCGMVHPQVLRNGGLDPEQYSGWAFGLGIDRFAMIKYDVNDIQHFFQSDVRFLEQF